MLQIKIIRVAEFDKQTYGAMIIAGRPRFVTLEEAWLNNQQRISCIPTGKYLCTQHDSPKFGSTYLVNDVPNRSHILFHPGNSAMDTEGCILVGSSYNSSLGATGITNSRDAFLRFLRLLKDIDKFELEIIV